MTGLIDWKIVKPFWNKSFYARLQHLAPISDKWAGTAARVFGKHLAGVSGRHQQVFKCLYGILFAVRRRSAELMHAGQEKLAWSLTNCVPAGGTWQGVNLTEAGKFCSKPVCPWCWYRKVETIQSRLQTMFPHQYSRLVITRLGEEAVYDRLQRAGLANASRQAVGSLDTPYLKITNLSIGDSPGIVNTFFMKPGIVWQGKELPVSGETADSINADILTALSFPCSLLLERDYRETIKYVQAMHKVKQFSCSHVVVMGI